MTSKKLLIGLLLAITITISLSSNNAYADSTGALNPSAVTTTSPISDFISRTNAFTSNNLDAVGTIGQDQAYGGFGISIPAGSTINGISVSFEGHKAGTVTIPFVGTFECGDLSGDPNFSVRLSNPILIGNPTVISSFTGSTLTTGDFIQTTDTLQSVVFSSPSHTATQLSNLWLRVIANCGSSVTSGTSLHLDHITIDIDYTLPDTTLQVITLLGDAVVDVPYGSVYVDAGATALDDTDGDITGDIVTGGLPIDTFQAGQTFIVTYDVEDSSGNDAIQVTRTVNVLQRPSGDSCNNCQQPSIGVTDRGLRVVDDGITVNGHTMDADFYFTPFPLIQSDMNEQVTMHFVIWDDRRDNIAHVEVGFGKGKIGESFGKLESSVIWNRHVMTKVETITFDETAFKDVSMTMLGKTNCKNASNDNSCDLFKVQFTPVKAIVGDVVFGISIWDDNKNAMTTFFNEGLQVGTESDVIPEIEFTTPIVGKNQLRTVDDYDSVMTRNSPNFSLVKNYELNRMEQLMKELYPQLFEEEPHSETIKVYLQENLGISDSVKTTKQSSQ